MTRREAGKAGREHVGPDHERRVGRDGNEILLSTDGTRRYRGPSPKAAAYGKRGQPYTRTGVQANFETGQNLGDPNPGHQNVDANVHVDVID